MTVRQTIHSQTPLRTAQLFQAVLGADKGYTSELVHEGADVIVLASDGQAVRFSAKKRIWTKAERTKVAKASDGLPTLGVWLARITALHIPALTEAIEGIWCGTEGEARMELPGSNAMLCVGWYHGKVEWSYLS